MRVMSGSMVGLLREFGSPGASRDDGMVRIVLAAAPAGRAAEYVVPTDDVVAGDLGFVFHHEGRHVFMPTSSVALIEDAPAGPPNPAPPDHAPG